MKSSPIWLIVVLLVALGALSWKAVRTGAPVLSDDSYQYLGAARHLLQHGSLATWVAHFEEQVDTHRLPVPLTHFAPGYPVAIAAVGLLGVPLPVAGLLLCAVSYLASGWLLWRAALELKLSGWLAASLAVMWLLNSYSLNYSVNVITEPMFQALTLAMALLMQVDLNGGGRRPMLLLGIGATAGAAYLVRYAGLFLLPTAGLYLLWRGWRDGDCRRWSAGGIFLAGALFVAGALRNAALAGGWRGFRSPGHMDLASVAVEMGKALYHIIFGAGVVARLDFWLLLFAAGAAAAAAFGWRNLRRGLPPALLAPTAVQQLAWMGILSGIYCAGIAAAALTTVANDFPRYCFALYPFALLAAGVVLQSTGPKRAPVLAALCLVPVMVVQARTVLLPPMEQSSITMRKTMDEQVDPGLSVRAWIASHAPASEPLFAANGQAVQYALDRPVVSIRSPQLSTRICDEEYFRSLMAAFHSRLIVLFPRASISDSPEQQGPFLRDVLRGRLPVWLRIAAQSTDVLVLECSTCAGGG
jgi:hypothetical protein